MLCIYSLTVTVTTRNGGYRKNHNRYGQYQSTQNYIGQDAEKSMVFHFDFYAPRHCSEDPSDCSSKPLDVGDDITRVNNLLHMYCYIKIVHYY